MSLDNNPLKQYFRRPAVYIRLPSEGKYYADDVVTVPESGEMPVYPMTAIDEITAKTPDALFNGTAMVDIIKSCIPDIKNPWSVNSIDLDAILIAIRIASGGSDMELNSECPKCNEVASYNVNLTVVLQQLKAGNYDEPLQIGDLKIKFRPLTYKEMNAAGLAQVEIQQTFNKIDSIENEEEKNRQFQEALKKVTAFTMDLLSNAIEYIQTPTAKVVDKTFILDYLQNCDKTAYIEIRDNNTALKSQTEIKPLHVKCIHCSNEYEQPFTLNTSDFFG